jgi:hypothetical protein
MKHTLVILLSLILAVCAAPRPAAGDIALAARGPSGCKQIEYDRTGLDVDDYYPDNCEDDTLVFEPPSPPTNETLSKRQSGPRYVVYADNWFNADTFPCAEDIDGYTHLYGLSQMPPSWLS